MNRQDLDDLVLQTLRDQPVTDLHTHCYAPAFGATHYTPQGAQPGDGLLLWGIDELVTYHYLIAEVFRVVPAHGRSGGHDGRDARPTGDGGMPYDKFWAMTKPQQADHIWKHLFVERTPISEACRGVLTTLKLLGLDPNEKTLTPYRKWFAQQKPSEYVDKVMELANVDSITMTNPVFDDAERAKWEADAGGRSVGGDPRFKAVLRIDEMLSDWQTACGRLRKWGYKTHADLDAPIAVQEAQRFLNDWIDRMKAIYVAVSLSPGFKYPSARVEGEEDPSQNVIEKVILPVLESRNMPFAMMIGSRRQVNPALRDAGDMVGKADILSVANLCAGFPRNKFLVTMLSRENQYELCVAARKFGNLMIFGCWWWLNNPSIIEEITRERFELLGTSFCPQHSDARILDQLIYKWEHSRRIIAKVLADKYRDTIDAGFKLTQEHVQRDARLLLRDNFREFVGR